MGTGLQPTSPSTPGTQSPQAGWSLVLSLKATRPYCLISRDLEKSPRVGSLPLLPTYRRPRLLSEICNLDKDKLEAQVTCATFQEILSDFQGRSRQHPSGRGQRGRQAGDCQNSRVFHAYTLPLCIPSGCHRNQRRCGPWSEAQGQPASSYSLKAKQSTPGEVL